MLENQREISIHALREEGDALQLVASGSAKKFLSTPSARRATAAGLCYPRINSISIHALREEGDPTRRFSAFRGKISIHALREEGDSKNRDKISIFKQIIQHSARI